MKKILNVLLAMCLCISFCQAVFAVEPDLEQVPDFYDESRLERIEQLKINVENMFGAPTDDCNGVSPLVNYPIISTQDLNVPLYQQQTTYYCGNACTQMVLSYFGYNISQGTLAGSNYLATDANGETYLYKITNVLNSYLGNAYESVNTNEISFANSLKYSININRPVICQVQTVYLPIYKENGRRSHHYVASTGYYSVQFSPNSIDDQETVYYNDPHYESQYYGKHSCYMSDMLTAIINNKGYFIMGRW